MPSIEGGGVEKNFFILANHISSIFPNVSIITVSKKFKNRFDRRINFITPDSFFWEKLKFRNFKYLICFWLFCKEALINKNLLVISFQANLYCCILSKIFGFKIIMRTNTSMAGWSKNFIKENFYKVISSMADQIIVNSNDLKKEYIKRFKINPVTIYNPLDKKNILKKSKNKINLNFFSKKTINFINVGRLVDQKDHLTLLRGFNLIQKKTDLKFKLLILGQGINRKKIEDFISETKLKKFIRVIDYKKNPYPYINKSDCIVLTSKYEGLPNVLLEGLVLNKFIISSNCPTGPKEILDQGKGGFLFKTGDEKDLFKKISLYMKNKKKCNKIKKHATKRLIRFDYNNNLKKYIKQIYKVQ